MKDLSFSIVVPIYKVEKFIKECIESLLLQSYPNFELILVDDGSPDNCGAIIDEYASKDTRISVIHKKNGGLISAWKAGVRKAKNDYLMFVDGDDWVADDLLMYVSGLLKKYDADLIQFQFKKDSKVENNSKNEVELVKLEDVLDNLVYYKGYEKIITNNRVNKVFLTRKMQQILDDIDDRVNIGEDKQPVFCYTLNCNNILLSTYEGYYYRQNMSSMTSLYSQNMYEKTEVLFGSIKKMISKYSEYDFSDQIKKEKVIFAIGIISNAFRCPNKKIRKNEFNTLLADTEIVEGAKIIPYDGLNFFCRRMVKGIRKKSYLTIAFWQKIKKVKNKIDAVKNKILHRNLR